MKFCIKKYVLLFVLMLTGKSYAVNVDLMILYTQDFANVNNASSAIQNYITYSNQVFSNSGMDIQFRLKHHQVFAIAGDAEVSESLRNKLFSDSQVMSLRDVYRPDIVVYLTRASDSLCGIAEFPRSDSNTINRGNVWLPEREMAFKGVSIVGWNCATNVFTHEIGHNLGGGHGPVASGDHAGIPIASSRGHGVRDVFRTVMAYSDVFGVAPRLAYHSNPAILYNGLPTGTSERNNAAGMVEIAQKYVQYYSACYPVKKTYSPRGGTIINCGTTTPCLEYGAVTNPRAGTRECRRYSPD